MREFLCSALIVQRASDGRKLSYTIQSSPSKAVMSTQHYFAFKKSVGGLPHHRRRFAYRVNVYSKRECFIVAQYDTRPHESLGRVLMVRNGGRFYEVGIELFRRIAISLRDKKDRRGSHELTIHDGVAVGRYLLNRVVVVENGKVTEVKES